MPFWPVVIATLVGVPGVLLFTGMGMIFAAAGYANGSSLRAANRIVAGWVLFAWLLAAAFGTFGAAPAWRASHGGPENFDGAATTFWHWLVGTAIAAIAWLAGYRVKLKLERDLAAGKPLPRGATWLVTAIIMGGWGLIIGWIVWPLVLWPVRGHFEWPDAATGWTHAAEVGGVLFALAALETGVRDLIRLFKR